MGLGLLQINYLLKRVTFFGRKTRRTKQVAQYHLQGNTVMSRYKTVTTIQKSFYLYNLNKQNI